MKTINPYENFLNCYLKTVTSTAYTAISIVKRGLRFIGDEALQANRGELLRENSHIHSSASNILPVPPAGGHTNGAAYPPPWIPSRNLSYKSPQETEWCVCPRGGKF